MDFEDYDKKWFGERLARLRTQQGFTARDMSLTLGQSPGYINNIENAINYPSMTVFLYICEFLGITPEEFFHIENPNPGKTAELARVAETLPEKRLDLILSLTKELAE